MLAVALVLAACGQTPQTAATQTPSASARQTPGITPSSTGSAAPQRFGVLINLGSGNARTYDLTIVGSNAIPLARLQPATRAGIATPGSGPGGAAAIELPYVSTSNRRVYYLDGDSTIKFVALDGSNGSATKVPGATRAHAAFAISPDDQRIAVSVLDYSATPVRVRLYVEDLTTGAHHNEIYASSSNYVWPIGWHTGSLVLAVGSVYSQQGVAWNPYDAAAYHVVDPATADRLATIGSGMSQSGCQPVGPLSNSGTACFVLTQCQGCSNQSENVLDWHGQPLPSAVFSISGQAMGAASPDGRLAICCDASQHVTIRQGAGSTQTTALTGESGDWVCWLDPTHVLSGFVFASQRDQPAVLDLGTGKVTPVGTHGFCAATMPPYPGS
jgi:hypothetical protein